MGAHQVFVDCSEINVAKIAFQKLKLGRESLLPPLARRLEILIVSQFVKAPEELNGLEKTADFGGVADVLTALVLRRNWRIVALTRRLCERWP